MKQRMDALINDRHHALEVPDPEVEVMEGVKWGRFDHFFTPAYWFSQVWYQRMSVFPVVYRLGNTLAEEIVACLLGGHGLPAEVGLAAFDRLKSRGLLGASTCEQEEVYAALIEPLIICGRPVRYRYPKQRSQFVAEAINRIGRETAPLSHDIALREWLLSFAGIGPKTASWITRNFLDSDNVAILDIHIFRAGLLAGLFRPTQTVAKHYAQLESRLVMFAQALGVRLSILDTLMWLRMRDMGPIALNALRNRGYLLTAAT
jgi:thermostable 8-oxoguanine DNA glycosylase